MKTHAAALMLGLVTFSAAPAAAGGLIERACLGSERSAANRELCACIQRVADATLSSGEQRRGAKFFAEPHLSQEVRASDRRADEEFWQHWTRFGATAAEHCQ